MTARPEMTPRRVAKEIAEHIAGPDPLRLSKDTWADAIEKALHDQIEACAGVADRLSTYNNKLGEHAAGVMMAASIVASAIRAMKGSKP